MFTHRSQLVPVSIGRAMRLLLAASCCLVFAALTQAQSYSYDFIVPGTSGPNWMDTGVYIEPNSLLQISATGTVDVSANWGRHPASGTDDCAPVSGYPSAPHSSGPPPRCYGLIARLTETGPHGVDVTWIYPMSESGGYLAAPQGGHLWFTVNDDNPGDNLDSFKVHVQLTTFPKPAKTCHPCPDDFDLKVLRGDYPDPRLPQVLMVLDGEIIALKQTSGATEVSVTQGSVVAKYGDLPNLKVLFETKKPWRPASFSKEGVIQGVIFKNDKMSLIMGTSRLELSSGMPANLINGFRPIFHRPTISILAALKQDTDNFSTLIRLIEKADLKELRDAKASYTLLAPTNSAFAKLSPDDLARLTNDPEQLRQLLLAHLIPGKVLFKQMFAPGEGGVAKKNVTESLKTLDGVLAYFSCNEHPADSANQHHPLINNKARVVKSDIEGTYSVIQVIDAYIQEVQPQ